MTSETINIFTQAVFEIQEEEEGRVLIQCAVFNQETGLWVANRARVMMEEWKKDPAYYKTLTALNGNRINYPEAKKLWPGIDSTYKWPPQLPV